MEVVCLSLSAPKGCLWKFPAEHEQLEITLIIAPWGQLPRENNISPVCW